MATGIQVVMDCANPAGLAAFWATALGYQQQPPPAGHESWEAFLTAMQIPPDQWNAASAIIDPDGKGPRIYFQQVPESKVVKNRVHLDLNVGGGASIPLDERRSRVDAEVKRLQSAGAKVLRPMEKHGEYWVVMQDPEGNEFCLQ